MHVSKTGHASALVGGRQVKREFRNTQRAAPKWEAGEGSEELPRGSSQGGMGSAAARRRDLEVGWDGSRAEG